MANADIAVRGIRTSIPPGYVLGRTSQGTGDVELIRITDLFSQAAGGGIVPVVDNPVSYLGFFLKGPLRANARLYGSTSHRNMAFPSSVVASVARAITVPTADASLTLVFDGIGNAATVTFLAGVGTGTITWLTSFELTAHAVPYILVPNVPDLTLGDVELLFAADL